MPYSLTAEAETLLAADPERADLVPLPRRPGGDGMTTTSANLRYSAGGVTQVESFLRLTDRSYLYCHTYPDHAPILAFDDAHVKVSFTVPDPDRVTEQDLALARKLAATVTRYMAELEKFAASTAGDGRAKGGQAA